MKIESSTYKRAQPKVRSKQKSASLLDGKLDFSAGFSDKNKEAFYREFSVLIKAGVDFNQSLQLLASQQKSKKIYEILNTINQDIVSGSTLFDALKKHKSFSAYEYYSIKIGEETRKLPDVLDQLQLFFDRKIKMRRQIISVITYPAFVLGITVLVLYFMLNYIVPMFASVFTKFGGELPDITKFVINLSENFNTVALVALGVFASIFLVHRVNKKKEGYANTLGNITLKIPFLGNFIRKIYIARLCQSLGLLLSAKTPLVTALELTQEMISFYPMKKAISNAKKGILKGNTLSDSLEGNPMFPQKIISLIRIGEQTNELDTMFNKLAVQYNDEIDHSTKMIGTILEPLIIIIIGGLVGFIMVAMYAPMFDLSKIIK